MSEKIFKIINGDSLDELKKFPDNYFDSVVTDPPYGLGKEPNANEMLKAWIEIGYMEVKGGGFMGKEWDAFVPQPLFWKEVFRVLKHGGHIVSFFGTRTYDWGVMAIRLAGFEIRDSLQFLYGSGFPKSHNIGKSIDKIQGNKREILGTTKANGIKAITKSRVEQGYRKNLTIANIRDERVLDKGNSEFEGWGSALKPAVEPIVLARKPLEKGLSIAENVLKWGTGGINIDKCRINTNDKYSYPNGAGGNGFHGGVGRLPDGSRNDTPEMNINGRFPANLIMSHHSECCFNGMKNIKPSNGSGKASEKGGGFSKGMFGNGTNDNIGGGYTDENGEEMVEDWTCVDGCPIKIMDEQSGDSKSVASIRNNKKRNDENIYGGGKGIPQVSLESNYSDKGGASRFFYTAKASKSERNFGLDGFEKKSVGTLNSNSNDLSNYGGMSLGGASLNGEYKNPQPKANIHPTVKPLKLIQYLVRLITPPNGKVLDPFNGSGTTGIACSLEGFEYTGIELDAEYCKISEARIKAWNEIEEYEQYKKIIENQEEKKVLEKLGGKQTNLFED